MNIFFDNIIFSLQMAGGISVYWQELIKRIKNNENITFFESKNKNINKTISYTVSKESEIPSKILRYLPFTKKLPIKSIFHSSYYRVSFQKKIVNITTVHDFTYEYYRKGLPRLIHKWQKSFAINHSDGVICVSINTKNDFIKFYPTFKKNKIKVIYNGVGDEFFRLGTSKKVLKNKFEILEDKKYILYIGDRSKYKNFDIAISVLENLQNYYLVVIGGGDFSSDGKMKVQAIKDKLIHYKGITGAELNILYNNAFCLLYPSSYEGFGIPIVESMKAGCPVVSTNVSSIPEVAGEACLLVDKINVTAFICAIKKLEDKYFRVEQIKKGLIQAKKFNWNKCFKETYAFYEEVINKKFK